MLGSKYFCHRNKDVAFVLTHHLKNIGALRMGWCASRSYACMCGGSSQEFVWMPLSIEGI